MDYELEKVLLRSFASNLISMARGSFTEEMKSRIINGVICYSQPNMLEIKELFNKMLTRLLVALSPEVEEGKTKIQGTLYDWFGLGSIREWMGGASSIEEVSLWLSFRGWVNEFISQSSRNNKVIFDRNGFKVLIESLLLHINDTIDKIPIQEIDWKVLAQLGVPSEVNSLELLLNYVQETPTDVLYDRFNWSKTNEGLGYWVKIMLSRKGELRNVFYSCARARLPFIPMDVTIVEEPGYGEWKSSLRKRRPNNAPGMPLAAIFEELVPAPAW